MTVSEGSLRGSCGADGVCSYLGVPYAAPPVGDLRWRPPQPAAPWEGVRDATAYGAVCPQQDLMDPRHLVGSESCLFLNVFAPPPERCPQDGCAVMFWIHGGAYVGGSGGPPYDGTTFIGTGAPVVVVTINYRLGVLGFVGSRLLRSRDPHGATGNYGLQDQRAAMAWVQRNIHHFGGDSSNVMIFGESAGAGSVAAHLVMPRSWPFHQKAVLESGAFAYWNAQTMAQAEQVFKNLLAVTGCNSSLATGVDCLLNKDAAYLAGVAQNELPRLVRDFGVNPVTPTVDGVELMDLPWASLQRGTFHTGIPLALGFNHDEGTIYVGLPTQPGHELYAKAFNMTREDFQAVLSTARYTLNASQVADVLKTYNVGSPASPDYTNWYWVATHFSGDYDFGCPSLRAARAITTHSDKPLFAYHFTRAPAGGTPPPFAGLPGVNGTTGAFHSSEIPFVWQSGPTTRGTSFHPVGDEVALAKSMADYWVNFATSGDPNVGTAGTEVGTQWPAYTAGSQEYMHFDVPSLSVGRELLRQQCQVIDSLGVLTERVVPPMDSRPSERAATLELLV